jgi:hypothetical protein
MSVKMARPLARTERERQRRETNQGSESQHRRQQHPKDEKKACGDQNCHGEWIKEGKSGEE